MNSQLTKVPDKESSHFRFYEHLLNGGTLYRDDKLNGKQEFITANSLGGDLGRIQFYGFQDLSIVQ